METKSAWNRYDAADLEKLGSVCEGYKAFLDAGKTERECVRRAVGMAEAAGFIYSQGARRCL